MQNTTLCFLLNKNEILLAMKKRGFGEGRWNGVGGKVLAGETIEQAALREMKEEIQVAAQEGDLESVGMMQFCFEEKSEWDQIMSVFVLRSWEGEPQETEEMCPKWFSCAEIPYAQMWPDDIHWLPLVLAGKKIQGSFSFSPQGVMSEKFDLVELT